MVASGIVERDGAIADFQGSWYGGEYNASPTDPVVDAMWAQYKSRGEAAVAAREQRKKEEAIHATSF